MPAEATALPFDEAIAFFRAKVNLPSQTWTDVWEGAHARAFVVAGAMRDELVADLRSAVQQAIENGATLEQFREQFDEIVARHGWQYRGGRGWRTRVIYETNLQTAYQAGRYKQAKAIARKRPYWRYRHSPASVQARKEHLAWDGLVLRWDDPWWRTHYPPNGWGCKCYVETLAERDLRRLGKSGPDSAPPVRRVTRRVKGQRVRVPEGIDPGWGYHVGEAAWGGPYAARVVREARQGRWEPLESPVPREQPPLQPLRPHPAPPMRPPARTRDELRAALEDALGGPQRVFELQGNRPPFRYPLLVHAETLARHLPLDRAQWVDWMVDALEQPQEVWARFLRSTSTGQVALRVSLLKRYATGGRVRNLFWSCSMRSLGR